MRRTRLKGTIIILYTLLAVVGILNMFSATIFSGFQNIQADDIDTLFNAYILEHGYKAIFDSSYKWAFVSPPFYYPFKEMLFESDNLLGTAPFYWFFRLFFDWTVSFQLWGIIQTLLTYISMIILLLAFNINPVIAGISGFAFAFGLPRISQLTHPQIFPQFYMCFSLLFLFRFLKTLRKKDFNLFLLFLTLQFIGGFYLGWFFVFSLLIAFFFYGAFAPDKFRAVVTHILENKVSYLKSVAVWLLFNGLYWYKYFVNGGQYKLITVFLHAVEYLNVPMSYLTPARGSLWSYVLGAYQGVTQENYIFPGILFSLMCVITLLLIIVPFIKPKSVDLSAFVSTFNKRYLHGMPKETFEILHTGFFTGVVLLLVTTAFFGQSIWVLTAIVVPGAEAIRYAARIWVVGYLWLFISGGVALTYILEKTPSFKPGKLFVLGIVIVAILDNLVVKPSYINKQDFLYKITRAAAYIKSADYCDFTYFRSVEMPLVDSDSPKSGLRGSKNVEAMWTSIYTGVPTFNGYTAWIKYKFDKHYTAQDLAKLTKKPGETVCIYDEYGLREVAIIPPQK